MTGDTGWCGLGGHLPCQDSPVWNLHLEVLTPFAFLHPVASPIFWSVFVGPRLGGYFFCISLRIPIGSHFISECFFIFRPRTTQPSESLTMSSAGSGH